MNAENSHTTPHVMHVCTAVRFSKKYSNLVVCHTHGEEINYDH